MDVVRHGDRGRCLLVLHGGPGAPGSASSLARALADRFRVVEPQQRRSDDRPLTVARHVADLDRVLDGLGEDRPAIVGHSWGAMLALAHAAEHPARVGPLVLVACGTFDAPSRAEFQVRLGERMDDETRRRLAALPREIADADERLAATVALLTTAYSHGPLLEAPAAGRCDARGHRETWDDMLRRQRDGDYPAAFASIRTPVLMLHGADDPHPGRSILASLQPVLADLTYREFTNCGHWPWLERVARDRALSSLADWLEDR